MNKILIGVLGVLCLNANGNATPGATAGAIVFGTVGAIACDELVRSNMVATPLSDEPWYLVWHHVGGEDIAGIAAGTACAIPASVAGAAIGVAVEATIVGGSITAVGVGTSVAARKALHVAWQASAGPAKGAASHFQTQLLAAKQWFGQIKFGPAASSSTLRDRHMEYLYAKQKGRDALCDVPLPPLFVGKPWKRQLNREIEIDHRIPRAKGGSDDISNLQLTHKTFNRQKQDFTGENLRRARARFCPV